ncbi:hypothetical protein ACLKOZ_21760, partial [Arthrobacter sp. R4]
ADALATAPLAELMPRFLPGSEALAAGLTGTSPAFSITKARDLLGWEPQRSWRTELKTTTNLNDMSSATLVVRNTGGGDSVEKYVAQALGWLTRPGASAWAAVDVLYDMFKTDPHSNCHSRHPPWGPQGAHRGSAVG